MKTYVVSVTLALLFASSSALGQTDPCAGADNIFIAPDSDVWGLDVNWNMGHTPTSTEIACIPPDRHVFVASGYCDAGSSEGTYCDPEKVCPNGICNAASVCEGGENDGDACDCPGGDCVAPPGDDQAGAIWLTAEPGSNYNLEISRDFTLHGTNAQGIPIHSRITGKMRINPGFSLVIAGDVVIEGDGGIIEGEFTGVPPLIEGPGRLTLQGDNPTFTCDEGSQNPGAPCTYPGVQGTECPGGLCRGSLIANEAFTISVELVNNAHIFATQGGEPIVLTGASKSGSGYWGAKKTSGDDGGSHMEIDCELIIDGPGLWEIGSPWGGTKWQGWIKVGQNATFTNLQDLVVTGLLELNNSSFDVPGTLTVEGGKLDIRQGFTSSGDLVMTSPPGSAKAATVTVQQGEVVIFGSGP